MAFVIQVVLVASAAPCVSVALSPPRSMCSEIRMVGSTSFTPCTPAFSSIPRLVQFDVLPVMGLLPVG